MATTRKTALDERTDKADLGKQVATSVNRKIKLQRKTGEVKAQLQDVSTQMSSADAELRRLTADSAVLAYW